jgi:hypothetical protein
LLFLLIFFVYNKQFGIPMWEEIRKCKRRTID